MVVVAGVVIFEGRILIARRAEHLNNSGLWEFPGGKLEDGEDDKSALIREFEEEFGMLITVDAYIGEFLYKTSSVEIELRVYFASSDKKDLVLSDHSEVHWVTADALSNYPFSPADIPVIAELVRKKI